MTIYVDASVVVAALTSEVNTQRAYDWLHGRLPGSLHISSWVLTEVASALALRVRMGTLPSEDRADALSAFERLQRCNFITVAVPSAGYAEAARLITEPNSTLRAGNALHLAIASSGGHRLATLDTRQAEAATRAGVPVEVLG